MSPEDLARSSGPALSDIAIMDPAKALGMTVPEIGQAIKDILMSDCRGTNLYPKWRLLADFLHKESMVRTPIDISVILGRLAILELLQSRLK